MTMLEETLMKISFALLVVMIVCWFCHIYICLGEISDFAREILAELEKKNKE